MHPVHLALSLCASLLVSCATRPTVRVVFSDISKSDLRCKTVTVGGLSADRAVYPGQFMERAILEDAGTEVGKRLKHSRALPAELSPPEKRASRPPRRVGSRLTPAFIAQARARGVDYLVWISLHGNDVLHASDQWQTTRTEYPSCFCCDVTEGDTTTACRSGTSCRSGCCGSCSRGEVVTQYHSSSSATRRMSASHQLVDTTTGRTVWRADTTLSRTTLNSDTSENGYPSIPPRPLPEDEARMMRCMSAAAIKKLPR